MKRKSLLHGNTTDVMHRVHNTMWVLRGRGHQEDGGGRNGLQVGGEGEWGVRFIRDATSVHPCLDKGCHLNLA